MSAKNIEDLRPLSSQIILGLISSYVSVAPSMALGFSAVALPVLKELDLEQKSWFASVTLLAMPIGCFISGPLTDKFGRLLMLHLINIIAILGWTTLGLAYYCGDAEYSILLLGRWITGLSAGLTAMPSVVYMAEVASPKYRGVFAAWNSISTAVGVMVVYILGYIFQVNWQYLCFTTTMLAVISLFLTFFFLTETPIWLIAQDRREEATKSMSRIYKSKTATPTIVREIENIINIKENSSDSCTPTSGIIGKLKDDFNDFMKPNVYKPFVIITFYFVFQQLSGLQTVVFYAVDIVVKFNIYQAVILIAIIRTVLTALVSILLKFIGCRSLSIVSAVGSGVSIILLGVYLQLEGSGSLDETYLTFIPLLLLVLYFFFGTLGYLTLPYVMAAEVFPVKVRCTAAGLTSSFSNVLNFFMVKFYIDMVDTMQDFGVFYFYGVFAFLGAVFFVFWLPETKGKTLQQIETQYFTKSSTVKDLSGV